MQKDMLNFFIQTMETRGSYRRNATRILETSPHNNHNTYANAIAEIRTFSKYINQIGRKAYIPDKDYTYWKKRTEFIPYLLNDKELKMFFDHLDSYSDKICMNEELIEKLFFQFYTECVLLWYETSGSIESEDYRC